MDSARNKRGAPYKPEIPVGRAEGRAESYDLSDQIDLSEYLFAIGHRWRLIAVTILLTVATTFIVTKFVMTSWYRAEAIIRPVGQNAILQQTTGLLSGIGGNTIGGLAAGILGGASGNDADEYMPILTSFAFTNDLVKKHQLKDQLLAEEKISLANLKEDPDWVVYRILKRRFECRFAQSTGNLTLYYQDQKRSEAERILGGMHYQAEPVREVKLIRCTAGSIFDAIIDLRAGSPTYRQWTGVDLSAQNRRLFYVPEGFAHGYLTLTENTEVFYQVSEFYNPEYERGVRWNDPAFRIQWPIEPLVISPKDASHPDFV